ncbi:MAG: amidoligase family protein [Rhodospirillales bacterium]|mgnify:CR=1 FL=1|tara:strand:- start:812 stop:1837 length:1026 start_codon:yes stop_codon:yes gene_type:complete
MADIPPDIFPDTARRHPVPATPPATETEAGSPRRVGVEIEFAGLDVPAAANLVRDQFGGDISREDFHRLIVGETEFGDFVIELDAQAVHKDAPAREGTDKTLLPEELDAAAREALGKAVTGIVPVEIVTPPMPWSDLGRLAEVTDALRRAGAKGTDNSLLYAFGLHLNPELPATDTDTILRHLKAYVILADWLRERVAIDLTRRLLPHADPFPKDYVLLLLDPAYAPDQDRLITDYLDHNPTRNRELDMLPLFRHLDEDAVTARLDSVLIKARPTFHYRLPDCALGDASWSPVVEWNRWVRVEELAADRDRLAQLAEALGGNLRRPAAERWLDELQGWLSA